MNPIARARPSTRVPPPRSNKLGTSAFVCPASPRLAIPMATQRRPARAGGVIASPRKGAPAPTDADDRFDDSRHPRETLASNGKQTRHLARGWGAAAGRGARVLSANALVSMSVSVGLWRLSLPPKLSGAPAPNRATRATIAFPKSDRPDGREPAMPLPRTHASRHATRTTASSGPCDRRPARDRVGDPRCCSRWGCNSGRERKPDMQAVVGAGCYPSLVPGVSDRQLPVDGAMPMPRQQPSRRGRRTTGSPRLSGSHAVGGRRDPRAIAFPMASADPQTKSDPASVMRVIATRGTRSCRARDPDESFRSGTSRPRSCALATFRDSGLSAIVVVADERCRPEASARPPAAALLVFRESSHAPGVIASGVKRVRPTGRDVPRSTEVNRDLLYEPDEHLKRDA